ncbi:MAG: succinate dehydrogenase/fumarate reductase iron-sulfur subunit [Spirochaetaceae bacterium]|nr:MAG: succinate dehydrogenase/fumarate reductase iron-sulfur subunit [Spirochaetaceae bacterium]
MSARIFTFRIFRYRPGNSESGRFEEAKLSVKPSTTVLDVLEELRGKDPTLLYRHSCHHGSCGTCACRINGSERLACLTRVHDLGTTVVTVEPLRKLGKLGDLLVDWTDFFLEYPAEWQTLRHSEAHPEARPPQELSGYSRLENCIECGACVSACPVEDFFGPAVLAALNRERYNRERSDQEPGDTPERERSLLEMAAHERGVENCRRALECSRVCPTAVYPARHIEELRKKLKG